MEVSEHEGFLTLEIAGTVAWLTADGWQSKLDKHGQLLDVVFEALYPAGAPGSHPDPALFQAEALASVLGGTVIDDRPPVPTSEPGVIY